MNNKDREWLSELYEINHCVPLPTSGGTKTASIAGFVGFSEDMRILRPWVDRLITGISLNNHPELEKGSDYDDPDLVLKAIKEWIAYRKSEQWQNTGWIKNVSEFLVPSVTNEK